MINDIIEIAKQAGAVVREGFGKNFKIDYKTSENNLVTEVDKASEKLITDFITKKYPGHSILAEEGSGTKNNSEYFWVVDPLDGTTNFAHGLPIFSVSIGVQKNNATIAGVVYDVMNDVIYSAEKGSGAFAGSQKLIVNRTSKLEHSLLVTGFPYNIAENPENAFQKFETLTKKARGVRRLGSAAIDFCFVASGIFEGFWEVHLHPWDICAGKLIVEEAGGLVTDFEGNEINIYSKKILASNGVIHDQIIKEFEKLK
ncbi:inositol monophosphatase [bacterium BMS3Abin03]|jgi:myo-inositol-1(or 4)-monophosphatase|nr:inositol monophosphatase [bacterium BMS3Abin03]MCG6958340.1 inositol monophosphatase [bacterium BMS3Abin03]